MNNPPQTVFTEPVTVSLKPGIYSWCTCGYTQASPWCDGRHMGKGFCPQTFIVGKPEDVTLCQCKLTQNPPYCDGSHCQLTASQS